MPNGLSDPDSQMGKTADYYVTIPSTVQLKPTKKADSINVRIVDGNDVKQTYAGNKKVQVLVQSSNDYQLIDSKDVNKKMAYVVQFEGKTLDSHNSVAGMLSNKSTELSGTAAIDGQDKVGDFSDILTFTIENK